MPKDPLQLANEALDKALDTEKRNKAFMASIGPAIISALTPLFSQLKQAISTLKVDPIVQVSPEFKIPKAEVTVHQEAVNTAGIEKALRDGFSNFSIPSPEVLVNVPKIEVPKMQWPDGEMPVKGAVSLLGINLNNPLPVQLRDATGKPLKLDFENLNISSGGGGGFRHVIVDKMPDISTSPVLQVSGAADSVNIVQSITLDVKQVSSSEDSVVVNNTVDVRQVSGSSWSVAVIEIFGSTITTLLNGDNRIPVSVETGGSGLTDAELRAAHLDVQQVSGSVDSVYVNNPAGEGDAASALRVLIAGNSAVSVTATPASTFEVRQVSGAMESVNIEQINGSDVVVGSGYQDNALRVVNATDAITSVRIDSSSASVAANIVDSTGVAYTGSNPMPIVTTLRSLDVIQASGSINSVRIDATSASVAANIVDSSGVAYSGANPLPIVIVSGSQNSTISVGPVAADVADDGSAPVQGGGIARTANPTAVAANDVVKSTHDDLGRQVMRPVQVRDLMASAYVSVANGTETTLLAAGGAGVFHDLIFIQFSNNSTAAVGVDLRSVTAGGIEQHYEIPANGVVGGALPVPWPQGSANNNWTIDLPDVSGTTVTASALFTKEV